MATLRALVLGLVRSPLFTTVAVLSLALGIGANTAIFSIVDQLLLRPLPVKSPTELVFLYSPGEVQGNYTNDEDGGPSFSYPMFQELRKSQTPFTDLAGMHLVRASVSYQNAPAVGLAELVTGRYFPLLGIQPALGRLFDDNDDQRIGEHPVVVLSYDYWQSRFGLNSAILNQKILVNGNPMTVVGVAPAGFHGDRMDDFPQLFVPMAMKREMTPGSDGMRDRKDYWIKMVGRLKPGMTIERATAEMNAVYAPQIAQDVELLKNPGPRFLAQFKARKLILRPGEGGRGQTRREARQPLQILMGVTILVLLLACANVANLQLARGAAKAKEIAVRLALGAPRSRLIGGLLAESCMLAVLGAGLGMLLARPTLLLVIANLPAEGANLISPDLDLRILLFALATAAATGIVFGLYPALQATRPGVADTLKDEAGRSGTGASNRFRNALATAQVAISLLLLIAAGLFAKSLLNLSKVNLGIRSDHLLTFALSPKLNQYDDTGAGALYERALTSLAAIPGVESVSAANNPAIADNTNTWGVKVEGFTPTDGTTVEIREAAVAPDYFRTMGIALVSGREFASSDRLDTTPAVVVNEAFVRKYMAGKEPLGRHITGDGPDSKPMEIVGVVKDSKYARVKEAPGAVFYPAQRQQAKQFTLFFYVRTRIDPEQAASAVRRAVADLDPNLPVRNLITMDAQIRENVFEDRIMGQLTALFAALATVLAGAGIYGVLAYNVARRTREIGIRMSLGAAAMQVRGMVLREVLWMLAIGGAIGLAGAWGATGAMGSMLFGLDHTDPATYAASLAALSLLALVAAYLPARSASSVDPMIALRHD